MAKVWAGGDCVNAGDDLTVTAVAQGARRRREHSPRA
jgi:NADPH-dependent glutamate synthase beta subunit-like oxidoreductase